MKKKGGAKAGALNSSLIRTPIRRQFAIFLLPTFICFCIGFLWPFVQGLYLSLHKFTTVSHVEWVGFGNYVKAFNDQGFRHAFLYTALVAVVSLVLIILHLKQPKKSALDIAIAVFNGLLIPAAAFCLASPHTIEPFVRFAVGIVTIVTGLINLIETLKIKNKKDWKFVVSVAGAVALIALGIVMAAAHVDSVAVTQRVIGIFLVLNAVANIWYFIQFRREARESERSTEQPAA